MITRLVHLALRPVLAGLGIVLACLTVVLTTTSVAGAASYVPISGEGSTWSANALNQWIADVQPDGMRVSFTANGSTAGRGDFIKGLTDFAATDIPFQTNPTDGSAPENPVAGSYAYMPITAGGTAFMYNLEIDGQRVTNLRLSGANLVKIFTGVITNWDNPALAADNPDLKLPNLAIVPVVRSDGAGDSFELTQWMISQYPALWNAYCSASGRAPACGATSFYPTTTGMIAQSGDLGVAGYVSQNYANGAIGYVNYSYALNDKFPVVQMLNAAGYYTTPTPQNVAVSLLDAVVDTTDVNNPALYLTENLSGVYTDNDPRSYPLSSYSYLILPTSTSAYASFTPAKGATLAAFSYYAMCQGQQQSAQLGYSPMPINLVEAGFTQIAKIPGADPQSINIQSCNNPTFTPSGQNLLAQTAPFPPACDKQGPTQCTTGTGGAVASTAVSNTSARAALVASGAAPAGTSANGATSAASDGATTTTVASCDPAAQNCAQSAASAGSSSSAPESNPQELAAATGWTSDQTLLLIAGVILLALIVVPGLLARRFQKRQTS